MHKLKTTYISFAICAIVLVGCQDSKLKKLDESSLIERVVNRTMPKPDKIVIKTQDGTIISADSLKALERSGEYFEDFYVDEQGVVVEAIIRKKTARDEEIIAKVNEKLNKMPPLKPVEIDCSDKVNLLQTVFDRDQGIRKGGNQINPNIDHENLEIIVSFLEKCGMPTLEEVNDVQMAGIWAVLQHAPPEYQSKYIPLLEKSAHNGDIKWSTIALMKDRALMHEGKPQIYGSQVTNGALYDLFEPQYVDQRRDEIGMGPLKEYLKRFNMEFSVPQKKK